MAVIMTVVPVLQVTLCTIYSLQPHLLQESDQLLFNILRRFDICRRILARFARRPDWELLIRSYGFF